MILKNETDYVIPNNGGPVLSDREFCVLSFCIRNVAFTSTAVYAYRFQERRYFKLYSTNACKIRWLSIQSILSFLTKITKSKEKCYLLKIVTKIRCNGKIVAGSQKTIS